MHEVEHVPDNVKIGKQTLVPIVELKAAELRTPKEEKESLKKLRVDQEANSGKDKKRRKNGDIYSGLSLQHVGIVSNAMISVPHGVLGKRQSFVPLKF